MGKRGRPRKVDAEVAATLHIPQGNAIAKRPSYVDLLSKRSSKWDEHGACVAAAKGDQSYQMNLSGVGDLKKTISAIKAGVKAVLRDRYSITKPLKVAYDETTHMLHLWVN